MTRQLKVITGLSVAAAVIFLAVTLRPSSKTSSVLREVPAGELSHREGRCFWKNEETPFTGVITENYPDGARKSRSILSNGLLHGVSEGWYPNGLLQVREHFSQGVSHGLREKWFESGVKKSEATIQAGIVEGTFKRWHENGAIAEEVQMNKGEPDGTSVAFNPDGTLKARVTLQNGKIIKQEFWNPSPGSTHASKTPIQGSTPAF